MNKTNNQEGLPTEKADKLIVVTIDASDQFGPFQRQIDLERNLVRNFTNVQENYSNYIKTLSTEERKSKTRNCYLMLITIFSLALDTPEDLQQNYKEMLKLNQKAIEKLGIHFFNVDDKAYQVYDIEKWIIHKKIILHLDIIFKVDISQDTVLKESTKYFL